MAHRRILTAGQRRALFSLPDDEGECRRRYALDDDDLRRIGRRRKPGNRLGFALQLCALRFPGRLLKPGEEPPIIVTHRQCEQPIDAAVVCSECRKPLNPGNVAERRVKDRKAVA